MLKRTRRDIWLAQLLTEPNGITYYVTGRYAKFHTISSWSENQAPIFDGQDRQRIQRFANLERPPDTMMREN